MQVLLRDPQFGARWDRHQWIARKLSWAENDEIPALQERRDRNTSLLRDMVGRNMRWALHNERLKERFRGVEKWRITQATRRSYIKLTRIDQVGHPRRALGVFRISHVLERDENMQWTRSPYS